MAEKWAIVIGISQYERLQSLQYAERDAQLVRDLLVKEAKFDQVYYFSDRSPEIVLDGVTILTQPTVANLWRFFELRFATPFLKQGDTLWLFFSGYGLQYADSDYLMPSDGEPEAADITAFTIDAVADCLCRSGADSPVLFLDACRTDDQKFGQGFGTDPTGVVSIFSADFGEVTQEIEAMQQGTFAHVLVEGVRWESRQSNPTIAHLFEYLRDRVPQINLHHGKPPQTPRMSANAAIDPEAIPVPRAIDRRQSQPKVRLSPPVPPTVAAPKPAAVMPQSVMRRRLLEGLAGVAILALGFAGISAYWEVTSLDWGGILRSAQLALSGAPPSSSASTKPLTGTASLQAASSSRDRDNFYQRLPKTGTYTATTGRSGESYREISSGAGRFCIKIVNTPTTPSTGYQQIIVSSLAFRENGIYIDATRERLTVDGTFTEITDSKNTWQWLSADVDRSGLVAECLAAPGSYIRQVKGGKVNPS